MRVRSMGVGENNIDTVEEQLDMMSSESVYEKESSVSSDSRTDERKELASIFVDPIGS